MKVISTRMHGVLDYVSAITLFALPRLLDWGAGVTTLLTIVAATVLIYSLITRYELSIAKLLPMSGHLLLDAIGGVGLLGAAFLFRNDGAGVLPWLVVLGLFELGAAFLTDSRSSVEDQGSASTSNTTTGTGSAARIYGNQSPTASNDANAQSDGGLEREVGGVRIYDDAKDNRR